MTPAARLQAAIEILDQIQTGTAAERALTGWARRSRFAGSKDRAAVRDHVFDALRSRRSFAALGGSDSGRGLMIGMIRAQGGDPADLFGGSPYGPAALNDNEATGGRPPATPAEQLDLPDWLWPLFQSSLGEAASDCARALQSRAPVHLRVNLSQASRDQAAEQLLQENVSTHPHPAADTALEVLEGARKIRNSTAYKSGIVELQDAASQAVVSALPLSDGMRVLDYCAGGGGKTLAMAARANMQLFAHDAAPERMRDLPDRAQRAGASVQVIADPNVRQAFDLILCDAPCSGSGSWRRDPEGKWRLTSEQLQKLGQLQARILDDAALLLRPGGLLAYATCSLLDVENEDQSSAFLSRHPGWILRLQNSWNFADGTDGFYTAQMQKPDVDAL